MIVAPKRTAAVLAEVVSVRTDGEIAIWTDGRMMIWAPASGEAEVSSKKPAPSAKAIRDQVMAPALAELSAGAFLWDLRSDDIVRMLRSDLGDLNWHLASGELDGPLSGLRVRCPAMAYLNFPRESCVKWGYVCEALRHVLGRAPRHTDTVKIAWAPSVTALVMIGCGYPQSETSARGAIIMGVRT